MSIWKDSTSKGHQYWVKIAGVNYKVLFIDPTDGGLVFKAGNYTTKIIGDSSATSNTTLTLPTSGAFGGLVPSYQSVTSFNTEFNNNTNTKITINKLANTLVQNTWTTNSVNLNTPRTQCTSIGTQNAALCAGGKTAAGALSNLSEKFNGVAWLNVTSTSFSATRLVGSCGTQSAGLSFGGNNGPDTGSTVSQAFNGLSWTGIGILNNTRYSNMGAGTQNAGLCMGGCYNGVNATASTEIYNGSAWANTGSMLTIRFSTSAMGTQNAALIFGGGTSGITYATSEKFNGIAWSMAASLVIGGRDSAGGTGTQSAGLMWGGEPYAGGWWANAEKFNGFTWFETTPINTAVYFSGGAGSQNCALNYAGQGSGGILGSSEKFNGEVLFDIVSSSKTADSYIDTKELSYNIPLSSQTYVTVVPLPHLGNIELSDLKTLNRDQDSNYVWSTNAGWNMNYGRSYTPGGSGTQTAALVCAGYTTGGNFSRKAETFNGSVWTNVADLNNTNIQGSSCGIQNSTVYVGGNTNVTEKYNGSTWTAGTGLVTGQSYINVTGIYNAALCFGGAGKYVTERYNGTSWSNGASLNVTRYGSAGCGLQNATVCYNGAGSVTRLERYDGTTWTLGATINVLKTFVAGSGTQNSALFFGASPNVSEKYNGYTLSIVGGLNVGGDYMAGAGTQALALAFGGNSGGYSPTTEKWYNSSAYVSSPIEILI